MRTDCPARIGFRYGEKGFILCRYSLIHNHEVIKSDGIVNATSDNADFQIDFVRALANLKIPCQVIQICVQSRPW